MNKIVKTVAGSHLYGSSIQSSDKDYKVLLIPMGRDIVLQRDSGSSMESSNDTNTKNTMTDIDCEYHSLLKFFKLLTGGQTLAYDTLYTPPSLTVETSSTWEMIQKNRDKFISKNVSSFTGYCKDQSNKYSVKGYRLIAAQTIVNFLEQKMNETHRHVRLIQFEKELEQLVSSYQEEQKSIFNSDPLCIQFVIIPGAKGKPDEKHLEVCGRKTPLHNTLEIAHGIYKRVQVTYGKRAQAAAEATADFKAFYHAVRISSEALELLTTGQLTFPRPEAKLLLRIRNGDFTYQQVDEMVQDILDEIAVAEKTTSLPEKPDTKLMEDIICEAYSTTVIKAFTARLNSI